MPINEEALLLKKMFDCFVNKTFSSLFGVIDQKFRLLIAFIGFSYIHTIKSKIRSSAFINPSNDTYKLIESYKVPTPLTI